MTATENRGDYEVFVALCPGEAVQAVELYASIGPILADDDDRLVWRLEAAKPVIDRAFSVVLGETPAGFDEVLPLRAADAISQMSGEVDPAVILTLTGGPEVGAVSMGFAPEDVPEEGYLDANGDVVPLEAIQAGLEPLCPAEPSS